MPKRRSCGVNADRGVAPLTCATHGPVAIVRATSPMAPSGTHSNTSSASRSSTRIDRSISRAATADPTRPRPITLTLLNMDQALLRQDPVDFLHDLIMRREFVLPIADERKPDRARTVDEEERRSGDV